MAIQDIPLPPPGSVTSGAVARLLLGDGRFIKVTRSLVEAYGAALQEDGLPVDRLFIVFPTLHPQARAVSYVWVSDGSPTEEVHRPWGFGPEFHRSPMARIFAGTHDVIRRRICDPTCPQDFGIIADLERQGFSDYLACGVRSAVASHTPATITFATRAQDGFSTEQLDRCLASTQLLALHLDAHTAERIAAGLADVYLGKGAGSRVLRGAVKRGDGESIPAAICFTDLRDFTTLSDQLPREALLELLNAYFDCVVGAVQAQGGEVLKFIGDAVLAIFRASDASRRDACANALTAAKDAFARAAAANGEREAMGRHPIEFGMSIHVGEVMYGNIGGPDRLDFTVIGPAVNVSSRIQGLCRSLDRSLLVSDTFMAAAGVEAEDLGLHALKGVSNPVRIFSPR
jgi:adenylate cyclase